MEIPTSSSFNYDSIVKASTGGETQSDGLIMLHKNEFIANSEITQGLRAIIDPDIISGIKKMAQTYFGRSGTNQYNQTTYNDSTSRQVVNNTTVRIEKQVFNDQADMSMFVNEVVRTIDNKTKG